MSNKPPIKSLSPKEVQAALRGLRAKYENLVITADDSRNVLTECIEAFGGLFAGVRSTTTPKSWWFFRIRTRSSFNDVCELLEPKQYTYPPARKNIAGRSHLPGYPVFYGSDSYDGAIAEMRRPDESEYLLAVWKLPEQQVTTLKFLCGSNIEPNTRLHKHKSKILSDARNQHGMHDPLNSSRLEAHTIAWSDLFLSSSQSLTGAIGHQCIYGDFNKEHDLLAYGSAVDGSFINFALPSQLADKLILHRLYQIRMNMITQEATWIACSDPPFEGWREVTPTDLTHGDPTIPTNIHSPS